MGKTLPRTPVNQPRIYPDLSAVKEVVEPTSDQALRKTELESEAENNKNIEDRVENDLKRKQEVNPTDTKQNSSTFKYSSTPISRNQNLYTNP